MSEVLVSRTRLRELEIAAELAANLLRPIADAKGDLQSVIDGMQEALARYEARMALSDAMVGK